MATALVPGAATLATNAPAVAEAGGVVPTATRTIDPVKSVSVGFVQLSVTVDDAGVAESAVVGAGGVVSQPARRNTAATATRRQHQGVAPSARRFAWDRRMPSTPGRVLTRNPAAGTLPG